MKENETSSARPHSQPEPSTLAGEPSLERLRDILLGKEIRDNQALHQSLKEMQTSVCITENFTRALRHAEDEPESYEKLVAALQSGTESAIQRSVDQDREPLTKALFPIMGPAIRSYVLDLFRNMAEELNLSIQNATSGERLKWRVQAKLMGKPYSEYVLLKTRSFKIEEVYLMQRHTGLLLLHTSLHSEESADSEADLVSGMFTAIRSFVKDSFARGDAHEAEDKELDSFAFGDREVLIEVGPSLVLAAVVHGVISPEARDELKHINEQLHSEMGPVLKNFSGDTQECQTSLPLLRQALIENQAETTAPTQGSFWRVWLFLGIVAGALLAVLTLNFFEQRGWNRFEEALRAEHGLVVTDVERTGWWRHRTVRGLRDPSAEPPLSLAKRYERNPKRVTFDFALVDSQEEPFVQARAAAQAASLEAQQGRLQELEKALALSQEQQEKSSQANQLLVDAILKSVLSEIPGLQVEFDDNQIRLRGRLAESDFAQLQRQLKPIESIRQIDTTGLSKTNTSQLAPLLKKISTTSLPFKAGQLDFTDAKEPTRIAKLLLETNQAARQADTSYSFRLVAHPLIGENRAANRVIEARRLTEIKALLVAQGIPADMLEKKIGDDISRAGEGVTIEAIER